MFNPQRKSKIVDIFAQEKSFQLHLNKINEIRRSASPRELRLSEEKTQERYLQRLQMSKEQIKMRQNEGIRQENRRLMIKLLETEHRPQQNPEMPQTKKHFHSYFSMKREVERIKNDNYGIINRMMNQGSMVPTRTETKKEFKQSKRYANMIKKLPAILKHEEELRKQLSSRRLVESKTSSYQKGNFTERSSTQFLQQAEK